MRQRRSTSLSSSINRGGEKQLCSNFSTFFTSKIQMLKDTIKSRLHNSSLPPPLPDPVHTGAPLDSIPPVTVKEVSDLLSNMPDKSSNMDFCPTSLLKSYQAVVSIIIARLANLSFTDSQFPSKFTLAQVTPLIKKAGLDRDDSSNYSPISNLNNISKIIECLFQHRIRTHVTSSPNFNPYKSAYRSNHFTESALILTLVNIYYAIDLGKSTLLVSLDLSAAFDTIDHSILLDRMQTSFGLSGTVL